MHFDSFFGGLDSGRQNPLGLNDRSLMIATSLSPDPIFSRQNPSDRRISVMHSPDRCIIYFPPIDNFVDQ
jgi:hypothetical protein